MKQLRLLRKEHRGTQLKQRGSKHSRGRARLPSPSPKERGKNQPRKKLASKSAGDSLTNKKLGCRIGTSHRPPITFKNGKRRGTTVRRDRGERDLPDQKKGTADNPKKATTKARKLHVSSKQRGHTRSGRKNDKCFPYKPECKEKDHSREKKAVRVLLK